MSDYIKRAKAKTRAVRRAEFRLRQRLEMIDWEYDTLTPELEQIDRAAVEGRIPEVSLVEVTDGDGSTV